MREVLEARAAVEESVRAYFDGEGFVEVRTPVALPHPNLDPNIHPIPLSIRDFSGKQSVRWLHTSPELSMKKLVARGSGSIYQITPVFRDGEHTSTHRCEFSMLEWYRVEADYEDAIRDTIRVVRAALGAVTGGVSLLYGGVTYDLSGSWEELTMAEAFERYAGVGSWEREDLTEALEDLGYRPGDDTGIQDLFHHLYVEAVEPNLGVEVPAIIRDYPAFLGTMAMPRPDDPGVLERFEVYVGGLELANGYTELTDPGELGRRMDEVLLDLQGEGVEGLTIDEEFIEAMGNLPPCAGVSVGLDRLMMLVLDARDIAEVVFPFEERTT